MLTVARNIQKDMLTRREQDARHHGKEPKMTTPQKPLVGKLLDNLPDSVAVESLEVLAEGRDVRIERIVSHGHASPDKFWYDQPQTEFVLLLTGRALVQFEGEDEPRDLWPGNYLVIPAHCRHRVAWTTIDAPSVWLAMHYDE